MKQQREDVGDDVRTVAVKLGGVSQSVVCAADETILAAAQKAGLDPPFSCTDGFCGCCMARVTEGAVKMINDDFLSRVERDEGWVLTCQARPVTAACSIEYPD